MPMNVTFNILHIEKSTNSHYFICDGVREFSFRPKKIAHLSTFVSIFANNYELISFFMSKRFAFIISYLIISSVFNSWAVDFSKLDTTKNIYYVKNGGTGDGSSWDKALGKTEFNYVLAKARNGATFHIAAGKYVPTLNSALEETTLKNACYTIKNSVTLVGGYPENPSAGDVSDPSKNETLFSTDVLGDNIPNEYVTNRDDDLTSCLVIDCKQRDNGDYEKVSLNGISFEGIKSQYPGFNTVCNVSVCNFVVDKCTFKGCYSGLKLGKCNATITDCTFEENFRVFTWTIGNINVNKSTFYKNNNVRFAPEEYYAMGSSDNNVHRTINVDNCTFFENKFFAIGGKIDSDCNFRNNTISMSDTTFTIASDGAVSLIGNIIYAKEINKKNGEPVSSKYNYYASVNIDATLPSNTDKTGENCPFIATKLSNNGGYTQTLALIYDTDADGNTLRFPRSECGLINDQRQMTRAEETCVGAFEKGATEYAALIIDMPYDTIFANQTYKIDGKYYPIGKHLITEKIKNKSGQDSIIYNHTLWVFPDPTITNYYVTKNGTGDKSGKSWENSMCDSSFAYSTSKVPNGTTFHIAEGIYHPIYTETGKETTNNNERTFFTNSLINIIGGYSEKEPTSPRDPSKYKTILSGDIDENDDDSQYSYDDAYNVLLYRPSIFGEIKISGVSFEHTTANRGATDALLAVEDKLLDKNAYGFIKLNVDSCEFTKADKAIITYHTVFHFNNCIFVRNGAPAYIYLYQNKAYDEKNISIIENSSFNNTYLSLYSVSCILRNNVIDKLYTDKLWEEEINATIYNNTILDDARLEDCNCKLTGNIFTKDVKLPGVKSFESAYNIYNINSKVNIEEFAGSSDKFIEPDDFLSILKNENGEFISENNGGYTPSVAVISDELPDGSSIRFPLDKKLCQTDQRGISRLAYTTPGSFEADYAGSEPYPSPYIHIIWNDVLGVDNSNHLFYTYQWYKDGVLIPGATKQYFQDKDGIEGNYKVLVNNELFLEASFIHNENFLWMSVQTDNNMINVKTIGTIPQGSKIGIYNAQGTCVGLKDVELLLQFNVSPGIYAIKLYVPSNSINVFNQTVKVQVK